MDVPVRAEVNSHRDKIGKVKIQQNVAAYKKKVLANGWEEMPQHFITSSSEATGKEELLAFIEDVNQQFFKDNSSFI